MLYYVRFMRREDIAQVTKIDRDSFPSMWPSPNYRHELANKLAHYIVACDEDKRVDENGVNAISMKGFSGLVSRVSRLFDHDRFFGDERLASGGEYVLGFAGFWLMADEAHLISIAIREEFQRQGIGERLLISVIDLAIELNARLITLEVRASNTTAQNLYSKYGFNKVGQRSGYYTDNREDAVLMSAENITSASFKASLQQLKQAHSRRWGVSQYQIGR